MKAVNKIPEEMISKFTMNNEIPILDYYLNGVVEDVDLPDWNNDYINSFLNRYNNFAIFERQIGEPYAYGSMLHLMAINKYPIKDKKVAVIGSLTPWIEAILLNNGAKHVTTVEYNVPICDNEKLKCISYKDFCESDEIYDAIFSYSSIEHSGLGRYGDELNPIGDIETLVNIKDHLKKDGLLYLGIPVGKDCVCFNAHRIYGEKRLKLIEDLFEEIEWIGVVNKDYIYKAELMRWGPQPIIIYKNTK